MLPHDQKLVELAQQQRLVSRKQAQLVLDTLAQIPDATAAELLLEKHFLTEDQLQQLQSEVAAANPSEATIPTPKPASAHTPRPIASYSTTPQPVATTPRPVAPSATPTGPADPPRQLSIADLKKGTVPPANFRNPVAVAGADPDAQPAPARQAVAPPAQPSVGGVAKQQGLPALEQEQQQPKQPAQPATSPGRPRYEGPLPGRGEAPAFTASTANIPKTLPGLLRLARHWGASDLHISVGRPPFVRMNGQIRYMEMEPLTPEQSEWLNFSTLSDQQARIAMQDYQLDFALEIEAVGRHRCNVFKQRLGWDGSYRIVRAGVPKLEQLGLPDTLRRFTEYHQGLVLVTGPGGSGKTTTAAALLDLVNVSRRDHIITVEDPIEYVIPGRGCQVTQREVGRHTMSFANSLRAALREDPDIIFIGEMRDHETVSISISAAETGHLVFATMHTSSAVRSVNRIIDVYPSSQQAQICTMVAESLRGVTTQYLIPRKDGKGAVLSLEVLVNTSGVAQQIKEAKTHMIASLIQGGKKYGMQLMDDSLMALAREGTISGREAYRRASNKNLFDSMKDAE